MSIGTLSCADAGPVITHKAQSTVAMLEVNPRPKFPMGPFVSMELILAFTPSRVEHGARKCRGT
jgi:hypothetical protein